MAINLKGVSSAELLSMGQDTLNKMTYADMKKITQRLVSSANKRLRLLEKTGYSTPASRTAEMGGTFTTRGKSTVGELHKEYSRIKRFMESKTSTKTGYIQVRNATLQRMKKQGVDVVASAEKDVAKQLKAQGKTIKDVGKREYNKMLEQSIEAKTETFFKSYEKLKESSPEIAYRGFKYGAMKEVAKQITENKSQSPERIAQRTKKELTNIYEKEAELSNESNGVSQFFEQRNNS